MSGALKFAKPDRHAARAKPERIDYRKLKLAKSPPIADPKYREWVRRQGCQLSKRVKGHRCGPRIGRSDYTPGRVLIDFAHTPAKRGAGRKASDLGNGIGLCHDAHMDQHRLGWKTFAKRNDIDPAEIAAELAETYRARFPERFKP